MSTQARNDSIPEWTRGDRLRKARSLTGLTSREFAEEIGVSQKTVTDAEGDKRTTIRKILLNAWALRSGVPAEWLEHGTGSGHGPTGGTAQTINPAGWVGPLALAS